MGWDEMGGRFVSLGVIVLLFFYRFHVVRLLGGLNREKGYHGKNDESGQTVAVEAGRQALLSSNLYLCRLVLCDISIYYYYGRRRWRSSGFAAGCCMCGLVCVWFNSGIHCH